MLRRCILLLLIPACLVAACAGGETKNNGNSSNGGSDTGSEDTALDTSANDSDDMDADGQNDDPCGMCCPGSTTCVDETTRGVCNAAGSEYEEESCGDGMVCNAGECEEEQICEPDETTCFDATTRLICRPGGTEWRQESCDNGESCISGECLSGSANGESCTAHGDCAGGKCLCGTDESCSPNPSSAICTAECTPGSCGPDAFCVAADVVGTASYDHCVPTCDDTCSISGLNCVALPTRESGSLTWQTGCYLDSVVSVGEEGCGGDTGCSGDTCLSTYFTSDGDPDIPFCTFECDGNCPAGTACVQLTEQTNYCTPICGDGSALGGEPCPLEPDEDRLDVTCEYTEIVGDSGSMRVCVKP